MKSTKFNSRRKSTPPREGDHLAAWLTAEEQGAEARSERALLELLAYLPEAQPEPNGAKVFAERIVHRIERDARSQNRWSLKNAATLLAASVLVCWVGAIVYAALLGVDPTRASSVGALVGSGARAVVQAPQFLAELLIKGSELVQDTREATLWAYSPWSLVFAASSLLLAGAALFGLDRLSPREGRKRSYNSASLGAV